jgi:hypothetical protein
MDSPSTRRGSALHEPCEAGEGLHSKRPVDQPRCHGSRPPVPWGYPRSPRASTALAVRACGAYGHKDLVLTSFRCPGREHVEWPVGIPTPGNVLRRSAEGVLLPANGGFRHLTR